ncbi:MAG: HIRAN domain-containing protein [Ruminiclostridium sp.]|nr:HIRAN domain-containing protein [Ruminiclostridium sp.]
MNELTLITGSALIEALHNGTPITVPERREIFLKTVYIAGWYYRENINEIAEGLKAGDRLTLRREPSNEHDALAIMVLDRHGNMLGYVPRYHNAVIARLMDAGKDFYAVLTPREPTEEEISSGNVRDDMHYLMRIQIFMRE